MENNVQFVCILWALVNRTRGREIKGRESVALKSFLLIEHYTSHEVLNTIVVEKLSISDLLCDRGYKREIDRHNKRRICYVEKFSSRRSSAREEVISYYITVEKFTSLPVAIGREAEKTKIKGRINCL